MDRERLKSLRDASPHSGQMRRRAALRDRRLARSTGDLWARRAARALIGESGAAPRAVAHAVSTLTKGTPDDVLQGVKELLGLVLIDELPPVEVVSFPGALAGVATVMSSLLGATSSTCLIGGKEYGTGHVIASLESILALVATLSTDKAAAMEIVSSRVMGHIYDLILQCSILSSTDDRGPGCLPDEILVPLLLLIGNALCGCEDSPLVVTALLRPIGEGKSSAVELAIDLAIDVCSCWSKNVVEIERKGNGNITLSCLDISLWFIERSISVIEKFEIIDKKGYMNLSLNAFRAVFNLIHSTNLYTQNISSHTGKHSPISFSENQNIRNKTVASSTPLKNCMEKKIRLDSEEISNNGSVSNNYLRTSPRSDCRSSFVLSSSPSISSTTTQNNNNNHTYQAPFGLSYKRADGDSSQIYVSDITLVNEKPISGTFNNIDSGSVKELESPIIIDGEYNSYQKLEGTTIASIRVGIFVTLSTVTANMKLGSIVVTNSPSSFKSSLPSCLADSYKNHSNGVNYNISNNSSILSSYNSDILKDNLQVKENNTLLNMDSTISPNLFNVSDHSIPAEVTPEQIDEICKICGCGLAKTLPYSIATNIQDNNQICPAILGFLTNFFKIFVVDLNDDEKRNNFVESYETPEPYKKQNGREKIRISLRNLAISYVFNHLSSNDPECLFKALQCTKIILYACGELDGDVNSSHNCSVGSILSNIPVNNDCHDKETETLVTLAETLALSGWLTRCVQLLENNRTFVPMKSTPSFRNIKYEALGVIHTALSLACDYQNDDEQDDINTNDFITDTDIGSDIIQSTLISLNAISYLVGMLNDTYIDIPPKILVPILESIYFLCIYDYEDELLTSPGIKQLIQTNSIDLIEQLSYNDNKRVSMAANKILELLNGD